METFAWKRCSVCKTNEEFSTPNDFAAHLRLAHCSREGGSFSCRYSTNGPVGCHSLPVEGVSEADYQMHVLRDHCNLRISTAGEMVLAKNARESRGAPRGQPSGEQEAAQKWSVYNSKVNLPAVLNDPRRGARRDDIFSKHWGISFETAEIQESESLQPVERQHFHRYLKHVFRRYKHAKSLTATHRHRSSRDSRSIGSPTSAETAGSSPSSLSIPSCFYEPTLNLCDPRTFTAVFGSLLISETVTTDVSGVSSHRQRINEDALDAVLEQMTCQADQVEMKLARHISQKSGVFFSAMRSQGVLQENMKRLCASIEGARHRLGQIDKHSGRGALNLIQMVARRNNLIRLFARLRLMETVKQIQPNLHEYHLKNSDFVGAMDLIQATQETLADDLRGIVGLRHLSNQLSEMCSVINKMIESDFRQFVSKDLNQPVEIKSDRLSGQSDLFAAIVLGFLRQRRFDFVRIYQREAETALKCAMKDTVVKAVASNDQVSSDDVQQSNLTEQVRQLKFETWLQLNGDVFSALLIVLQRVKDFFDLVIQVGCAASGRLADTKVLTPIPLKTSARDGHPTAETRTLIEDAQYVRLKSELRDMFAELVDCAHDRCAKLLAAKAKDHGFERISPSDWDFSASHCRFLHMNRSVDRFVEDCYRLSGHRSMTLKLALNSQANRFVARFHQERLKKISMLLENEIWKQASVPYDIQELLTYVETSGRVNFVPTSTDASSSVGPALAAANAASSASRHRSQQWLLFDGQRFAAIGTVVILLRTIVEYCSCAEEAPSLAGELMTSCVELVRSFNSQTCQLVLGAGALDAGLKKISSKTLALAARNLQLVHALLPRVRSHFDRTLSAAPSLAADATPDFAETPVNSLPNGIRGEVAGGGGGDVLKSSRKTPYSQHGCHRHFDKLESEISSHMDEIHAKLLQIVDQVLSALLVNCWQLRAPVPSDCIRDVVRKIQLVYESVGDILSAQQLILLFESIHKGVKGHMNSVLREKGVRNDGSEGLALQEFAYYTQQLSVLRFERPVDFSIGDDVWADQCVAVAGGCGLPTGSGAASA